MANIQMDVSKAGPTEPGSFPEAKTARQSEFYEHAAAMSTFLAAELEVGLQQFETDVVDLPEPIKTRMAMAFLKSNPAQESDGEEGEATGRPKLNGDQKGTFQEWMRRMYGDLLAIGERFNFDPQIDRAREEFNQEMLYQDWVEGVDPMDIAEWWVQTEGLNMATTENLSEECLAYIAHDRLYPIVQQWYDEHRRLASAVVKRHGMHYAFQDDEGVVYQPGRDKGKFVYYPEFEILRTVRRSAGERQGSMSLDDAEALGFTVERLKK